MDELIKLVAGKVGISPDQAESAVKTVLGFLKDKLPEPLGGQIEKFLGDGGGSTGGTAGLDLDAVGDALGGLFGKK